MFGLRKKVVVEPPDSVKAMQEHIREQQELLREAGEARMEYNATKDVQTAISKFEDIGRRGLKSSWDQIFLADLYVKNHENDKAWGLLNKMILERMDGGGVELHKIHDAQYRLLKKEKRWKDAMLFAMFKHAAMSGFARKSFMKDANVPAKELGLTEFEVARLAQIASGPYDAIKIRLEFESVIGRGT